MWNNGSYLIFYFLYNSLPIIKHQWSHQKSNTFHKAGTRERDWLTRDLIWFDQKDLAECLTCCIPVYHDWHILLLRYIHKQLSCGFSCIIGFHNLCGWPRSFMFYIKLLGLTVLLNTWAFSYNLTLKLLYNNCKVHRTLDKSENLRRATSIP